MIIKSKTRKNTSFWQAIQYVLREDANPLFTLTHNIAGDNPDAWTASFFSVEGRRRKKRRNAIKVMHIILSWHPQDSEHLTEVAMKTMTRAFMRLYNPHSAYLAVAHSPERDAESPFEDNVVSSGPHVHIIASGVDRFGRSMSVKKARFRRIKNQVQQFQEQRFPELTHSRIDHERPSRNRLSEREYWLKQQGKELHKDRIAEILEQAYIQARSREEFITQVQQAGVQTYDRGGKTVGIHYEGKKYRFRLFGYGEERLRSLESREPELLR